MSVFLNKVKFIVQQLQVQHNFLMSLEIGVRYLDLVKGDGEQCKKGIMKLIYC